MTSITEPSKFVTPFAESGLKNTIPATANNATGKAGFDKGFPERTMLPKASGGIPPSGMDFNGILYDVTSAIRYMQAGGRPTYDSSFASAIGGYPLGAVLIGDDGVSVFQNAVAGNQADPNSGGAGWARPDLQMMELYRRSYAEAGYNVVGTFREGFTIVNANDVGIDETTGRGFTGPVGPVAAGTDPTSGGFVDASRKLSTYTFMGTGIPGLDTQALVSAFATESAQIILKGQFSFNNTSPLSLQEGSAYLGDATITSTDPSKSIIHTFQKNGFILGGSLKFKGDNELIASGYGSKLVMFEECVGFVINDRVTFGPSCWDGLYFRRCSDFRAVGFVSDFNKSSGFTLEDCKRYYVNPASSSNNGRISGTGGLPDLVVAMDSHKGRGFTVFCKTAPYADQENSVIALGSYKNNTEFGLRVFAQESSSNPGVKNLTIHMPVSANSGAPAGTYGPVVTVDKGVDIVVNDNASSPNENIRIVEPQITRSLLFGNTMSLAGDVKVKGGRSFSELENDLSALLIFSGTPDVEGHETDGFGYYYTPGSGSPTIRIKGALGRRLKAVQTSLISGSWVQGEFRARAVGAVDGMGCDDRTGLNLDVEMYGFASQITINHNTAGVISARTFDSITQGIQGKNSIFDPTKLALRRCSFDKAFPQFLGSTETLGEGTYAVTTVYSNAPPSVGQGIWPDGFFVNRRFKVTSGGGSVLQVGWLYRLATDTWSTVGHTIV